MAKQCQSEQTSRRYLAFEQSLLTLLRSQTLQSISVKDICQVASIPRRTFYHYFAGKEELTDALIRDLLLACDLAVLPSLHDGADKLQESLLRFFLFWRQAQHRETLELLLKNEQGPQIIRQAHQWVGREYLHHTDSNQPPDAAQMVALATISGLFSLLFFWIQTGCRQSAEEMSSHTACFLSQPTVLW